MADEGLSGPARAALLVIAAAALGLAVLIVPAVMFIVGMSAEFQPLLSLLPPLLLACPVLLVATSGAALYGYIRRRTGPVLIAGAVTLVDVLLGAILVSAGR